MMRMMINDDMIYNVMMIIMMTYIYIYSDKSVTDSNRQNVRKKIYIIAVINTLCRVGTKFMSIRNLLYKKCKYY